MKRTTIRIGGVPEHFNLPIHLAHENGAFLQQGIDVEWTIYKGGTGQMTQALKNGETDLCILLTEGITQAIIKGNPSKIISNYVLSPLIWGIHTAADNPIDQHQEIYDKRYAISRFGSGSHLMAIVDATSQKNRIKTSQFNIIRNLDGALESLQAHETDIFYWEKYTTKPFVDAGQLKRIGQYVTPWPCFVIAATDEILAREPEAVIRILRTIHEATDRFMQDESMVPLVSERYGLQLRDAGGWYRHTKWAIHPWVSKSMLDNVVTSLQAAGIVEADREIPKLVWEGE